MWSRLPRHEMRRRGLTLLAIASKTASSGERQQPAHASSAQCPHLTERACLREGIFFWQTCELACEEELARPVHQLKYAISYLTGSCWRRPNDNGSRLNRTVWLYTSSVAFFFFFRCALLQDKVCVLASVELASTLKQGRLVLPICHMLFSVA